MILCIETATRVCSVALCDRDNVVSLRESNDGKSHSADLTVFIDEIFRTTGIAVSDLQAVAVSKGPGSYTGLRIGVSTAKGLAYGASIPLLAIDTTLSMFRGYKSNPLLKTGPNDLFCPCIDARRMEIYHTVFTNTGTVYKELKAEVINELSFSEIPESKNIHFFGDGAEKLKSIVKRPGCVFDEEFIISASSMREPAFEALDARHFEDVAYFEPFYLKDFITTTPVKKVL